MQARPSKSLAAALPEDVAQLNRRDTRRGILTAQHTGACPGRHGGGEPPEQEDCKVINSKRSVRRFR